MKKQLILPIILLVLFSIVVVLVVTNNVVAFDESIYTILISKRCNALDIFFKSVTKLANPSTVMIVMIFFIIFLKGKYRLLSIATTLSSLLSNTIIKHIIRRARPDHLRLIKQGGYSFPSGHTMMSIALYGFLIYFVNKKINNKVIKYLLISLLTFIIICIGLSRVYVGVHYPSDVLAGYLLQLSLLQFIIIIFNHYRGNSNVKNGCK